ncbi:MAG TPA: acetyl-CoA acetyltransferase [Candidatus Binatia bacterium]|nr:acetyl-CoA acetyltransferase [Candidatus Binatia bacterium]
MAKEKLHARRGTIAIVGAAESDEIGKLPGKSALMLHAEGARNALADAGLTAKDVDAVLATGRSTANEVPEYLGIRPRYLDNTQMGGCSFIAHLEHAMGAIDAGVADVVLITHGESGASRVGMGGGDRFAPDTPPGQWEMPFGIGGPATRYALAATRHMHEFGTTREQLAEVAVSTRKWASLNPRAMMRDPITVADVLESRPIAWPFNLLDCCLVTDGGGALVVTSAERARDCRQKPVWVLGTGEASAHSIISQMPRFHVWDAALMAAERAWAMSGVERSDVDLAMIYDAFTIVPILALEALGFCPIGEGGAFVSGGRTAPGGELPMNTNGGGLSYTHTGMYGMFLLVEAVRQLRGECGERQVEGATTAVCHGTGGILSASATAILSTER